MILDQPLLIDNIKKYNDERGYFYQNFSYETFFKKDIFFIVDNFSYSKKNVIRGLHYQWDEPLDKLVMVSKGKILDVIVDLRTNSSTFGKVFYYELSEENLNQLWVPSGFAHGYSVLSEDAQVQYKFTKKYNKNGESGINIFDDDLKINWKIDKKDAIISDRDKNLQSFKDYKSNPKFKEKL